MDWYAGGILPQLKAWDGFCMTNNNNDDDDRTQGIFTASQNQSAFKIEKRPQQALVELQSRSVILVKRSWAFGPIFCMHTGTRLLPQNRFLATKLHPKRPFWPFFNLFDCNHIVGLVARASSYFTPSAYWWFRLWESESIVPSSHEECNRGCYIL